MPYDHGLMFQDGRPLRYDRGDFPASLAKVKALVGWDDFAALREQAAEGGRRVGLGLGCYVEGTGVGPYEGGHVHVETSGRVNVSTGLTTQGQGHQTFLAQIVADELGVRIEDVHVTTGDTRRMPYAVGTFASRSAVMSGNAVALAASGGGAKALEIAGRRPRGGRRRPRDRGRRHLGPGCPRLGARIDLSTVAVLSNPLRYAFDESAKAATQFAGTFDPDKPPVADDEEPGLEGKDFYSPTQTTFANGMHAAIVETDPVTAEIRILRYCVVHDCGVMVNPMIVEGQVHGGVAQGVGGALYERMVYDESGQLLNASFMDFLMPYASEVPHIETDHLETPSPLNPLGIKGAGEAGTIPVSAVSPRPSRMPRGSRSARCRSARPSCGRCGSSTPPHRPRSRAGRLAMRISGSSTLEAPVDKVWEAILDPAVLARCLPGCETLAVIDEDRYAMSVTAGVAAIQGTYAGRWRCRTRSRPSRSP